MFFSNVTVLSDHPRDPITYKLRLWRLEVAVKIFLMNTVQVVLVLWSWNVTQKVRVKGRKKEYAYVWLDPTVMVLDVW